MGIYGVQVKSPSGKTKTIRIDAKSKRIAPVPLKKYFGKKFRIGKVTRLKSVKTLLKNESYETQLRKDKARRAKANKK